MTEEPQMFEQLDHGVPRRPVVTRELYPAADPLPPLTARDYEAFAAIGQPAAPEPEPPPRVIVPRQPPKRIAWDRLTDRDWMVKTDRQLGEELGCRKETVLSYRKLHNKPNPHARKRINWKEVTRDQWAQMRDSGIAAMLGCSEIAVYHHRRNHDLPPGPRKARKPYTRRLPERSPPPSKHISHHDREQLDAVPRDLWGQMSNHEISLLASVKYNAVCRYRRERICPRII